MRLAGNVVTQRLLILATVAALSLLTGSSTSRVEYALLDLRFAINRSLSDGRTARDVAVLLVTPESEQRLGEIYSAEWRQWYPDMLATLAEHDAGAVVWDATFLASVPEHDNELADAFARIPVVAARNSVEPNNPVIRSELAAEGWKQLVVLQSIPRRTLDETPVPPLGEAAARVVREPGHPEIPEGALWLDFSLDATSSPVFDIADVIGADAERLADGNRTPLSVFTDRVVFIGTDLPGADRYPVPGTRGESVPGVFAQVVSMWSYLAPTPIQRVAGWTARAIVFLPGALVALAGMARWRSVRRYGTTITIALVLIAPPLAFALTRLWLPYAAMLLISGAALLLVAAAHRLQLARSYRTSLGFAPHLLERHFAAGENGGAGIERPATVLCADVRNYTQFVTDCPGDEVQRVMSEYMAAMEDVVHHHGGYVNKFVGDEIIAVFGFPLREEQAEHRATIAARDMLLRVQELNAHWSLENLPLLDGIGIGIDTGNLRFTRIGGTKRVQFDVIGSAINGASRLQTLTKQMGFPLIVSAEIASAQHAFTVEVAAPGGQSAPSSAGVFEFIGEVMIRGQGRRRLFGTAQ